MRTNRLILPPGKPTSARRRVVASAFRATSAFHPLQRPDSAPRRRNAKPGLTQRHPSSNRGIRCSSAEDRIMREATGCAFAFRPPLRSPFRARCPRTRSVFNAETQSRRGTEQPHPMLRVLRELRVRNTRCLFGASPLKEGGISPRRCLRLPPGMSDYSRKRSERRLYGVAGRISVFGPLPSP